MPRCWTTATLVGTSRPRRRTTAARSSTLASTRRRARSSASSAPARRATRSACRSTASSCGRSRSRMRTATASSRRTRSRSRRTALPAPKTDSSSPAIRFRAISSRSRTGSTCSIGSSASRCSPTTRAATRSTTAPRRSTRPTSQPGRRRTSSRRRSSTRRATWRRRAHCARAPRLATSRTASSGSSAKRPRHSRCRRRSRGTSGPATRSSCSKRATCTRGQATRASTRNRTTARVTFRPTSPPRRPGRTTSSAPTSTTSRPRGRLHMLRLTHRARGMFAAAVLAVGALVLGACDPKQELLAPQQPSVIDPSSDANATAANALYAGALGRWKNSMNGNGNNTEALWNWEALFTDELRSADTFSQRNDADQRNLQTNDSVLRPIYNNAQQARGRARDAINALLTYDTSPSGQQHVGELYLMMGYIEMEMSQAFCNGIPFGETVDGQPVYTQPLADADGSKLAIARFDTALTYLTGTDAGTANIKNAVLVSKARAQVDVGDFTGAAATVASVPTNFQYTFDYSRTTFDNEWWIMGPSVKRYNAGDSVDAAGQILNAIPFAELNDPRVSVTVTNTKAEDNIST